MNGIFGNLADSLAKTAAPGAGMNTGVGAFGAAGKNQGTGLFGLGGPSVGGFDKIKNIFGGMFGGNPGGQQAGAKPMLAEGGGIAGPGDGNPYSTQVTTLDTQIQAAKSSIMSAYPEEQWQNAMKEIVMPLMLKRQELTTQAQEWEKTNNSQVQGGQQIQTPGPGTQPQTFKEGGKVNAGADVPKTRKITIEEKPLSQG